MKNMNISSYEFNFLPFLCSCNTDAYYVSMNQCHNTQMEEQEPMMHFLNRSFEN